MWPRLCPLAFGVVAMAAIIAPIPASAQCATGTSEIWGNDLVVTPVESDTRIGLGLSFYAVGPTAYALWNDSGSTPIPHSQGSIRWAMDGGLLMHELGHNLRLCHGGPVIAADNREVIFMTSDNGRLYKVDAQTGAPIASVDTRRPCCTGDQIVATPAVQLFSLSNSAFRDAVLAERGMSDDLVFVATYYTDQTHNTIKAYWASTLTLKWDFNPTGSLSMGPAEDGCEIDYGSNALYCGTTQTAPGQSTLWAVQTLPGSLKWSWNAGSIQNRPRLNPGSSELYLSSIDGMVQKRNPLDGSLVWSYPVGSQDVFGVSLDFRSPLPTRVFCTTADGLLHGLVDNFPSPVPLWPPLSAGPGKSFTSRPIYLPLIDKLYVGRSDGYLQEISASGVAGPSALVGRPGVVLEPSLDYSTASAQVPDRLMVSTTEGSVKRFCIPWSATSAVSDARPTVESALRQNAPNPFAVDTRIEYQLPYDAQVEIGIYDVDGQRVRTLVHGQQPTGPHQVNWNGLDDAGRSVASGSYFYRLRATGPRGSSLERAKKIQLVR